MAIGGGYNSVSRFLDRIPHKKLTNTPEGFKEVSRLVRLPVLQFSHNVLHLGNLISLRAAEAKLKSMGFAGNRIYIYLLRSEEKNSLNFFCIAAWGAVFEIPFMLLLMQDCEVLIELGALVADRANCRFLIGEGWTSDGVNMFKDGELINVGVSPACI